jgi:hypothetical protein
MMKQIKPSSMGSTVAEALTNNDRVAMIMGDAFSPGLGRIHGIVGRGARDAYRQ